MQYCLPTCQHFDVYMTRHWVRHQVICWRGPVALELAQSDTVWSSSVCWACEAKWWNLHLQSEAPEAHQGISSVDVRWQYATLSACCHRHRMGSLVCPIHAEIEAAQIPWPVRYRLSRVQSLRLRLNPVWQDVGSAIEKMRTGWAFLV